MGDKPDNSRSLNAPTIQWVRSVCGQTKRKTTPEIGQSGSAVLQWDSARYRVTVKRLPNGDPQDDE